MAIKTGEIFNSLVFGGVNSADYGIYITGEGVFNAPKRAVNMVAVPGRNGSIAIDQGHWDNIEVTYPAGTFGMDEEEFRTALSNFRNAIASQVGYQRLTDTYHPDEYRMAIYTDGLEVEPTTYNKAGEFELKFNCKPQRWLTAGEVPVTIGEWGATKEASGEIVTIESEGGEAAKSLEVSLEPIQEGSGEPSPTNIRPISGHTEVVTQRTGKNLLNADDAEIGTAWNGSSNSARARLVIPCKTNTTYTLSMNGTMSVDGVYRGTSRSIPASDIAGPTRFPVQITTGASDNYITLGFNKTAITKADIEALKLQLEFGSTATAYEPYQGTTHTTALGQTVYGGTLDVVSGVLTVDRAMVDLTQGMSGGTISGNYLYYKQVTDAKTVPNSQIANVISEAYEPIRYNGVATTIGTIAIRDNKYLYVNTGGQDTLPTGNAVYELATPQTYQLTPQQISLLLGENHLWSDGSITMQYGDDPNSLWNPTQYDAGPLLAVKGHGDVSFNGYTVAIDAGEYGLINVKGTKILSDPITYSTKTELYNSGDTIEIYLELQWGLISARSPRATRVSNLQNTGDGQTETQPFSNGSLKGTTIIDTFFLSSQDTTLTNVFSCDVEFSNGHTATTTLTLEVVWDSANSTLSFHTTPSGHGRWGRVTRTYPTSIIEAVSSKTYLGDPTLVDCELGEAYKVEDGEIISLNKYIELGSDLPTLSSGANDVTTDNTITELQVTPNWWKL